MTMPEMVSGTDLYKKNPTVDMEKQIYDLLICTWDMSTDQLYQCSAMQIYIRTQIEEDNRRKREREEKEREETKKKKW